MNGCLTCSLFWKVMHYNLKLNGKSFKADGCESIYLKPVCRMSARGTQACTLVWNVLINQASIMLTDTCNLYSHLGI